jgi:AraC-like DNA-binding protein
LNGCAIQEANGITAKKKVTREELYRRLSIAKDYLSSCYYEQITIDQLAATCYLNPFYLIREFKKLYNITPHQFLTKLRLREAEKMIANSQKQISGILQEVGFEDLTSFSKLFKKEYGVSPITYRKQAK